MPFHCLAIRVPAVKAPTENYDPKDTHLSDLQMLRQRYLLSSTTQHGNKGERFQGYCQFLFLSFSNRETESRE